ncbi:MAG: hypothetical protein HC781_04915 [Leptolyngbyaceae cyanobacterium CSU_1_4]|nr:hypothetical protein [Leptolyngbyaceae cyanobacterium CSU_1_4]
MKMMHLKTTCFNQWTVKRCLPHHSGQKYYKFLIGGRGTIAHRYKTQQRFSVEATASVSAYLSAYFYCLRANLDNEKCPALVIDRQSGYILSINLPAFELLAIDAVGFQFLHFAVEPDMHQQIDQELQETGESSQTVWLQNADACSMKCTVHAMVDLYYSQWAIFRLNANPQSPNSQSPHPLQPTH